jgi:uncharacterized protein (TIGR00725 family)
MKRIIIGVMGPGSNATKLDQENAYKLGQLIAQNGWVLLTGGRCIGVMESAMKGAKSVDGLTIGILPDPNGKGMSEFVDIPIFTDLGNARNNVNVLSSDVVIACGIGLGTVSEITLALKNGKKVVLLTDNQQAIDFLFSLDKNNLFVANSPEDTVKIVANLLTM